MGPQGAKPTPSLYPAPFSGWLGARWQRAVFEGAKQCRPCAEGTEAGFEGCVGGWCLPSGGRIGWAQGSGVPEYPLGASTLALGFSGSSRPPLSLLPAMGEPWWRVILGPACCESPRQGRWWAPSGRHSQAPRPTLLQPRDTSSPESARTARPRTSGWYPAGAQGGMGAAQRPRPVGLRGEEPGGLGVKGPGDMRMQADMTRVRAAGTLGLGLRGPAALSRPGPRPQGSGRP